MTGLLTSKPKIDSIPMLTEKTKLWKLVHVKHKGDIYVVKKLVLNDFTRRLVSPRPNLQDRNNSFNNFMKECEGYNPSCYPQCQDGADKDKDVFGLVSEITALEALPTHPGIIQATVWGYNVKEFFVVYQHYTHGDLFETCANGRLTFEQTIKVIYDVCQVVYFVHSQGVSHGDIKLENFLLPCSPMDKLNRVWTSTKHFSVVLADWEYSHCVGFSETRPGVPKYLVRERHGTEFYCSPELYNAEQESHNSYKSDIWSLAVTIFILLFCEHPFTKLQVVDSLSQPRVWWRKQIRLGTGGVFSDIPKTSELPYEKAMLEHAFVQMFNLDTEQRWSIDDLLSSTWWNYYVSNRVCEFRNSPVAINQK